MTDISKTAAYTDKLYGRKWKVSVLVPKNKATASTTSPDTDYVEYILSDSTDEDKALRVTFNINKHHGVANTLSEVCIYNLNVATENMLIENGYICRVEAGYTAKDAEYGLILDSVIYQPMWEREDNVTKKLTLITMDNLHLLDQKFVLTHGAKMTCQKTMVAGMAAKSSIATPVDISEGMSNKTFPRDKVFCNYPMFYYRQYCQQSGTLPTVIGNKKVKLERLQDPLSPEAQKNVIVITAGTTNSRGSLVGTPQQTQNGVTLTCLLNPNITVVDPPNLIKLDNSRIRQIQIEYGNTKFANMDQDWLYRVIGVTHVGDTRGNEWYSHIIGVNQNMEGYLPYPMPTKDYPAT